MQFEFSIANVDALKLWLRKIREGCYAKIYNCIDIMVRSGISLRFS